MLSYQHNRNYFHRIIKCFYLTIFYHFSLGRDRTVEVGKSDYEIDVLYTRYWLEFPLVFYNIFREAAYLYWAFPENNLYYG